jgi:DNA-binding transcriptional MerR regulator
LNYIDDASLPKRFGPDQTAFESKANDKFMFIGELAIETGIDPKTIRFYEHTGLLSPPRHGKFRTYMASDVQRLKEILALRRIGVCIASIRILLELNNDVLGNSSRADIMAKHIETLRLRQTEVAQQIEGAEAMLRRINSDHT